MAYIDLILEVSRNVQYPDCSHSSSIGMIISKYAIASLTVNVIDTKNRMCRHCVDANCTCKCTSFM